MKKDFQNRKPNIVMILSDDQGCWAMGCYGNPEIKTPCLDSLAASGVRFENYYCTSPVCSPARASILTGKIPSQHGIHDYLCEGNGGAGQAGIGYLDGHLAYTDLLNDQGYVCGLSGKWHLGDGNRPQKGFSFWYVHQKGGGPYYQAPMIRDGQFVTEGGYITDIITDEALNFLDQVSGQDSPFYLGIHYTAPHSPWVGNHPKEYTDLYQDCPFESCPQQEPHPWALTSIMPGYTNSRENLIGYFAAVTAMDFNIGRIISALAEKGLLDDTIICFMSDNGFNCGHHGIWGKGNGTFPLNMYESSVKVPMIMSWKGHLPSGSTCSIPLSAYDFMPSLLELVQIENPYAANLPGRSFISAITGKNQPDHEPVVVFDEYGPVRMIRTGRYKYIHRYPYGPHELFDLARDPGEKINLIGQIDVSELADSLKRDLDQWFHKYVDPAVDGSREGVLGGGQLRKAGIFSDGHQTYRPNNSI